MQFLQFDDKVYVDFFGVHLLHQLAGCGHGTAGSQQVVVQQDNVVFIDGVLVHLHRILTVFFLVAFFDGLGGQFAGLADGHETGSQAGGEDGAHDESARLDAHNLRYTFVLVHLVHCVCEFLQGRRVLEQGCHVVEQNARYREVGYFADAFL